MRTAVSLALLTALHAFGSVVVFLMAFAATSVRLDRGARPALPDLLLDGAVTVLFFPVVNLTLAMPVRWFPGPWGYVPLIANSLLWASVLVYSVRWARSRRA